MKTDPTYEILVIEDSHDMQDLYAELFAQAQDVRYQLTFAGTARDGVDTLPRQNFDCVLLDYELPDGDGLSVLRRLKNDLKSAIPVIMITGAGHERLAVSALKLGACDYLVKNDVTLRTLIDVVRGCIQRRRDAHILGQAREMVIVKQQNVIDRQKRQLQAFEIEMLELEEGHEIH